MVEHSESYWNDLLDQYISGKISEENRFALERRALDDPFLFDALEGFELYSNEIQEESPRTRLLTLPRMAAAASVIFLVSMIFLLKDNDQLPVSENQPIAMVLDTETDDAKLDDSNNRIMTYEESEAVQGSDQELESPKAVVKTKTEKESAKEPADENKKPNEAISTKTTSRVVESLPKTKVAEEVLSNADDLVKEDVEMPEVEQMESVDLSSAATAIPAKKNSNIGVSLEETADVSVSNDASAKMKKKEETSVYYIVEPLIGKRDFDDFVQQRLNALDLRQSPPVETIIEFTIHPDGSIDGFTHILDREDGCSECGALAIAILEKSGIWRTVPAGNTGRARYKFKF